MATQKNTQKIKPDLLHAHYVSGYGTLARLSGFPRIIMTAWGSDVFSFPRKTMWTRLLLEKNLACAHFITASSHIMKTEIQKYTYQRIEVVPFGVDLHDFKPDPKNDSTITTLGTLKTMHPIYGIDILLKAFQIVSRKYPDIKFLVAGGGPYLKAYQKLSQTLGLQKQTQFLGPVEHSQVADVLNQLDLYCAFSREESFGVSILEAMACGVPVIVSPAPGLKEIVGYQDMGIVLEQNTPQIAAQAICRLIEEKSLAQKFIHKALQHVRENYDWQKNVAQMILLYRQVLES